MKRPCAFVVADGTISQALRGFFGRDQFHRSLGCGAFGFDPKDIIVAVGANDPGLYSRAQTYARGALTSHDHIVVVLDADWRGSPGADQIRSKIEADCVQAGWPVAARCVVVLDPEIEVWLWQDNPHVETAVGHAGPPSLRERLAASGDWPAGAAKPRRPKETLEHVLAARGIPRSSSLYSAITSRVSVNGCTDPAFHHLVNHLRRWFPPAE